jgi:hypothetical protein
VAKDHWLLKRTVSIGYYAVTEYSRVTPQPDYFSEECLWHDIQGVPKLIFDHNLIIDEALKALRMQIYHQPIGYNLLPFLYKFDKRKYDKALKEGVVLAF